jgi:hypothetical protein
LAAFVITAGWLNSASAQFTVPTGGITEAMTVAEIESALTTAGATFSGTTRIDGVALGPGNTVYIAHSDSTEDINIAHIDLDTNTVAWFKSESSIVSDLGLTGNLTLIGEMVWDPINEYLVLASDIGWAAPGNPYTLFTISTNPPYTASVVLSDASIQGWNSHDVLPDGRIFGALGEEYEVITGMEPTTGVVDPSATTPAFVQSFDVDDLIDAVNAGGDPLPAPPNDELPPETIGVDLVNGIIYVFGHDNFELLAIDDALTTITDTEVNGWDDVLTPGGSRVDLHGIDVDVQGNVFGYNEAAPEAVEIWDGNDTASDNTGSVLFDDIADELSALPMPPDFEVTVWRGMKARKIAPGETEIFLASATNDYGLVRVVVNYTDNNVQEWSQY